MVARPAWKCVTDRCEDSSSEVLEMKTPSPGQLAKAARSIPVEEHVPYMFEKRIMAHLANITVADLSKSIASVMWRAAFSCLLITVVTSAVVAFAEPSSSELLASDLERTVLAPVDVEDSW